MTRVLRFVGELVLTLLCAWGWVHVFVLPFCGLLFRCGCTWPWAGGIDLCNIYDPAQPDCPWCTAPALVAWVPFQGQIGVMTLAAMGAGRLRARWWVRPVAAAAAFLCVGLALGMIFKIATGYPYFLWNGPPS